ncbi:hypothetical protein [Amycolatopsis sp. DSM 110486]|uniref:hypothetical protein n=1 Tax=Amycolatopsis sp. DSM 110486 TaxID=2865832 RepID=UPI001C6999F3|nr:hypothetical protein [Amycolatopsis sp. DSM 110486]QYN17566.1 hypothetical protein K1T34_32795 [Amycolatopsis sp. DSM 110486]
MPTMYLAQWAKAQNPPVATSTAYRWFREGKLPPGVNARKQQSGTIVVEPVDPLAEIDPEALVRRLAEAGYVVLTREQVRSIDESLCVDRNDAHQETPPS